MPFPALPPTPVLPESALKRATPAELEAYLGALEQANAALSPLDYAMYVNRRHPSDPETSDVDPNSFVEHVSEHIVALIEGRLCPEHGIWTQECKETPDNLHSEPENASFAAECPECGARSAKYLCLSAPPRHGKSFSTSQHAPAWFHQRYPHLNTILTGYGGDFAAKWGRVNRDHIANHPELGVSLSPSSRGVTEYTTREGGEAVFVGVGGAITGKGAHFFIIDDAIKNQEEAFSETHRQKMKDWFDSVADRRLEPGGVMLVMATRWHEDDLVGYVQETRKGQVYTLSYPALSVDERTDPLGRPEGEALVPSRYPLPELEGMREAMDPWVWAALYQQNPRIAGGGLFQADSVRHWEYLPSGRSATSDFYVLRDPDSGAPRYVDPRSCRRFVTVDLAASERKTADWTVFAIWDVSPDKDLLLVGMLRMRVNSADHFDKALEVKNRFKPRYFGVEKQTFGMSLIRQMQRASIPVRPLNADKDKVSRAIPASSMWNAGRVWLPKGSEFSDLVLSECLGFPNAKHDDIVDCLAYAALEVELGAAGAGMNRTPAHQQPQKGSVEWLHAHHDKKQKRQKRAKRARARRGVL